MPTPNLAPDLSALGFGEPLDEALRAAHPNQTRKGCPSRDTLVALSRRERSIGDPAYEHLLDCSPCYSEVREVQLAWLLRMNARYEM